MKILGFSHYNLRAPQALLDTLRDFYTDIVGLTLGDRPAFPSFGYWLYIGDQAVLHLSEANQDEIRATAAATTFDHVAFNCAGRREFERKLTKQGIEYEVAHVQQTNVVQLFFADPAGNGVELSFRACDE